MTDHKSDPTLQVLLVAPEPQIISDVQSLFSEIKETNFQFVSSDELSSRVVQSEIDLVLLSHNEKKVEIVSGIHHRHTDAFIIVLLPTVHEEWIEEYTEAGANGLVYRDRNFVIDLSKQIKRALIRILERKSSLMASFAGSRLFSGSNELDSGSSEMKAFEPGQEILHYQITEQLGEGGMGQVYCANDLKLARKVAIKVLPPRVMRQDDARKRLIREARAASRLNHPNIITIHSIEETPEASFIVMEHIDGESVRRMIQRGPVDLPLLLDIGIQTATALSAAHDADLVHRDIKPDNIMVTSHQQAKLLDFGLAKSLPSALRKNIGNRSDLSDLTEVGVLIGTLNYMSPEQTRAEALDSLTDIFSLGAVLYHAATAKLPFDGASALDLMHEIATLEPTPPSQLQPSIPRMFDEIIMRAMAKSRNDRYQSALEFAEELRKLKAILPQSSLHTEPPHGSPKVPAEGPAGQHAVDITLAEPPNLFYRLSKRMKQQKIVVALLIGMLLSAAIFVALNILGPPQSPFTSVSMEKHRVFLSVFPFENETDQREMDFASRGLSMELSRTLAQENFMIVPFSDVQGSLTKGLTPLEATRKAGGAYFVKGSLKKGAAGMNLNYSLIEIKSGKEYSDSLLLSSSDFLSALNQIKTQLLSWLQIKPNESPVRMNVQAFEFYLKGLTGIGEMEQGKSESFAEAKAFLQRALETGPSVEIFHGLAYLHYQAINLGIDFDSRNLELCRYYLDRGLALRPDYGPLIDLKTRYEFYKGRPDLTLRIAADQIKSDRFNVGQIGMIGLVLRQSGNFRLSELFLRYALKLSPESYYMKLTYSSSLFQAGRHPEAMDVLETLNSDYPEKYWGKFYLSWFKLLLGNSDEGQKLAYLLPDTLPTRILRYQSDAVVKKDVPFNPDHRMLDAANVDVHFSFRLAQCYSLSGNSEKAFIYLKSTVDKGWIAWNYFDWDPMLANLRQSDSYQKIRSEGLPVQKATIEMQQKLLQPVLEKLGIH